MRGKKIKPDGHWVPVHQEIGGNLIQPENYLGQKLVISGSTYSVLSEKADEGIIKTNGTKLDIYGTDGVNKGRHLTAIYQIVKERLTICYDLEGHAYPKKFDTSGQASYFLCIFEKTD